MLCVITANLKRIKRICTDDPLDRICAMGAEQCNALNCYDAATEAIVVRVGKFGTISLSLCQRCAETKFQTRAKTTRIDEPIPMEFNPFDHAETTE